MLKLEARASQEAIKPGIKACFPDRLLMILAFRASFGGSCYSSTATFPGSDITSAAGRRAPRHGEQTKTNNYRKRPTSRGWRHAALQEQERWREKKRNQDRQTISALHLPHFQPISSQQTVLRADWLKNTKG